MDLLDRLRGHDRWTTARLLNLSRGLTDVQLDQPFYVGHQTLRATFDHMISGVKFWMELMAGQQVDAQHDDRSLTTLINRHEPSYATFTTLARRLHDEQRLDDTLFHSHTARESFGGTIAHVILHNAQHRGEALHILERLGVPNLPEGDLQEWEHETQGI